MIRAPDWPVPGTTEAATFRTRGVAVPFTAPMLASARMRSADRGGIELILPNPSGGPGVFITDWSGAASLRGATMHDTLLFHRIARLGAPDPHMMRLGAPDPRTVREAALSVAEDGYAGPAAADAARVRRDSDKAARQRIRDGLLTRFAQGEPAGEPVEQPAEAALARTLGVTITAAATALRICCDAITPIGLAPSDREARLPRTIARLDAAARDITDWIACDAAHDADGIGAPMAEMLRAAAEMGRRFLNGLRRWFGEPLALLRRTVADPQSVREQADRALWLMDGWERPSLIWQAADSTAMRRLALLEIAQGLPVLPTEALSWTDPSVGSPPADLACRVSFGGNARLTGAAALTLIRRNEALRALSL